MLVLQLVLFIIYDQMSTSGSPAPNRKRGPDETGNYVPNENSQEGWADTPGSSRVRLVESTSTHILERVWFFPWTPDLPNADCSQEWSRNNAVNVSIDDVLLGSIS